MRNIIFTILATGTLSACGDTLPVLPGSATRYEVYGVEEGDMLKVRGGPGTGFDVYAGLPNGTIVKAYDCARLGHSRWCKVALDRSPGLVGYVSQAYLRKL